MPRRILFVQGGGAGTHDDWDRKLVASLEHELGAAYEIRYPHMPDEANPGYDAWKAALVAELDGLGERAVVIGHSIGGAIAIHVLAERTVTFEPAAIFLIAAPFFGPGGWSSDDIAPEADLGRRLPPNVPIFLYHGSDDEIVPCTHLDSYAAAVPAAQVRLLSGRDHQLRNDLSEVAADIRRLA